ncbi:MAG: hypothetical protein ABJZ55_02120 [Fuerstiella sp.]
MSYLNENPLPGILILVGVAVIAWLSGSQHGKRISLICIAFSVGLYFLEQTLISTGEEVEAAVVEMLENFKKEDLDAIGNQIADHDPELITLAEQGLDLVDLGSDFQLKSADTTVSDNQQTVTAYIRANGPVLISNEAAGNRHVATYWKTTWVRQDSSWKLKYVTQLNPTNGAETGAYSNQ